MRILLIALTVSGAFLAEWTAHAFSGGKIIFLPLWALVFCFWIWRMELTSRLWFALALGLIADTVQLVPFGTLSLTCVLVALVCETFERFFSNTEAKVTQGVGVALLILAFGIIAPASASLLNMVA